MDGEHSGPVHVGRPSRRTLLRTMSYAAGLALVGGCGVRIDLPQPAPPAPTRRKVPDEDLLVATVRGLRVLVDATSGPAATGAGTGTLTATVRGIVARLDAVLREQERVLVGRLTNDGVPTEVIDGAPSPAGPASTGATTPPAVTDPAGLAELLDGLDASTWSGLSGATAATQALLAPAASVRVAGASLLGRLEPFSPTPSESRPELADRSTQLVRGFEVVAGQSSGETRKRALGTLERLRRLSREVGEGAGRAAWALPFPVRTEQDAVRLATHLFTAGAAATVDLLGTQPTPQVLEDVVRWSGRVQALGTAWSVPLTAFPGTEQ